jgi:hypothetical protein
MSTTPFGRDRGTMRRAEIASAAARSKILYVVRICACGHKEGEHFSVGKRECFACDAADAAVPCPGFHLHHEERRRA